MFQPASEEPGSGVVAWENLSLFSTEGRSSSGVVARSHMPLSRGNGRLLDDKHNKLIQLLEIAMSLSIPLFPFTWSPAAASLGSGATGQISEGNLSARDSLAFKRFHSAGMRLPFTRDEVLDLQYNAMASEIAVLGSEEMRRHPNITTLQGISFDVVPESDEVQPVLVFSKATVGNLVQFIAGQDIVNPETLLAVCGEVAKAIRAMHLRGIVHGDVKPQNVLVTEDLESGAYGIKVADFGYSCCSTTDDDLLLVPQTRPWEAPEWHHRFFTVLDAKRMDIYSFGLLCLWLFFKGKPVDPGTSQPTLDMAFSGQSRAAVDRLDLLKREDNLLWYAQEWLKGEDMPEHTRSSLSTVFRGTICKDPKQRTITWDDIIEVLCDKEGFMPLDLEAIPKRIQLPNWHGNLSFQGCFMQLDIFDFRVHSAFAQSIKSMANGEGCTWCSQNAAFQLALCYSIGFGVRQSLKESLAWLQKSGKTHEEFSDALDRLKRVHAATTLPVEYESNLSGLYARSNIMTRAINEYRAIVDARSSSLGATHLSTLRHKKFLADMLSYIDEHDESLAIYHEVKKALAADNRPLDAMRMGLHIADVFLELGRFEDTESLLQQLSAAAANSDDVEPAQKLQISVRHLSAKQKLGLNDEVIATGPGVVQSCLETFGASHTTTYGAQTTLATAHESVGDLGKSATIHSQIAQARESSNGVDHPQTAESLGLLGVQRYQLGQVDKALECYHKILDASLRSPEYASPAVTAVNNYAARLLRRDGKEACKILAALLPEAERVLGATHASTQLVMGNLAAVYHEMEEYTLAETIARRVLELRRADFGPKSLKTLAAIADLSGILFSQQKWEEAANLLAGEPQALARTAPDRLTDMARSAMRAEAWDKALHFLEQEQLLGKSPAALPDEDPTDRSANLEAAVPAATCLLKLHRFDQAKEWIRYFLHGTVRWQATSAKIVGHLPDLACVCLDCGLTGAGEQVLAMWGLTHSRIPELPAETEMKAQVALDKLYERLGVTRVELVLNPDAV